MEKIVMNKQMFKKPIFWTIACIIFGCIASAFGIISEKVNSLEPGILFLIFSYIAESFFVLAVVCGLTAIYLFVKTRKIIVNNPILKKPILWTVVSIFFGCIGEAFGLLSYKVESLESDILYGIICFTAVIFDLFALVCGFKTIGLVLKTRKILHIFSGIAQILLLVFVAYTLLGIILHENEFYRSIKGSERQNLEFLRHTRIKSMAYMSANKQFPDANSWSIPLYDPLGDRKYIKFAFNKNLSNASIEQVPGNIVLLVEVDNEESFTPYGTDELLKQPMKRDKYCLFSWQPFKYILFVDGTIGKYRRLDGAISLYTGDYDAFGYEAYDKAYKSFGPFQKKGDTPYSPLKWK